MTILTDKADFTGHMVRCLLSRCQDMDSGQMDGMKLVQLLAGLFVETAMIFDDADQALMAVYARLRLELGCEPSGAALGDMVLPPSYVIDSETEKGRSLARHLFEDWLHCPQDFVGLSIFAAQHLILAMEQDGQHRAETFRLLIECANRCMAYEIAAQELCEVMIEQKIGLEDWSLSESISGLSAISGRLLALSFNTPYSGPFQGMDLPDHLDCVAHVMTQEAVRLGIPAGSDWRFGLAANDRPCNAPYGLIAALEPVCGEFFPAIGLHDLTDQSVACAKASGRMLAMASGGERPEIEPVIAKPLAMAAMTETYRTVCQEYAVVQG